MRVGIGGPLRISTRVPGPRAAHTAIGGAVQLVFYAVATVVVVAAAVIAAAAWLIWQVLKAWWRAARLVTVPLWWPLRGWRRHRHKVADRKYVDRHAKDAVDVFAQPPTGSRIR